MKRLNFDKELSFVYSEKSNMLDKDSVLFELLNASQILLGNYINAKTNKSKFLYKSLYWMVKEFYEARVSEENIGKFNNS